MVLGDPICINVDERRFKYILDWYRYGEISLPSSMPISGLLRDARVLQLPEEIIVNGISRSTLPLPGAEAARSLLSQVFEMWQDFHLFFSNLLDQLEAHFRSVAQGEVGNDGPYDFLPFMLPLFDDTGWHDVKNICSGARARALALKLEEEGYWCHFSETELIVRR